MCVFKYQYKSVHTQMYFSEGFKNVIAIIIIIIIINIIPSWWYLHCLALI